MESLRKLLEKVNTENPTPFDLKIASLSNYYIGLERKRNIKKIRRLKLLVHLYPSIIEKNSFRVIQKMIESPTDKTIIVRNTKNIAHFENIFIQKHYGDVPRVAGASSVAFRVLDLYEYFGLGD